MLIGVRRTHGTAWSISTTGRPTVICKTALRSLRANRRHRRICSSTVRGHKASVHDASRTCPFIQSSDGLPFDALSTAITRFASYTGRQCSNVEQRTRNAMRSRQHYSPRQSRRDLVNNNVPGWEEHAGGDGFCFDISLFSIIGWFKLFWRYTPTGQLLLRTFATNNESAVNKG